MFSTCFKTFKFIFFLQCVRQRFNLLHYLIISFAELPQLVLPEPGQGIYLK